ncbi:acetate uptake transporter [Streptomyces sp. NPDC092296]|uniref:acetate uptake transporter n=1 Tax=Streptomyces sp. NPDC092296 TaxID=3366012 RepID=UPI003808DB30
MSNEATGAANARPAAADAGPLGHLALGLTLLAFGLLQTGVVSGAGAGSAGSLALLVGGVTLFLAGLWQLRRGDTFSGTAFAALGAFWATWSAGLDSTTNKNAAGLFLLLWALLALTVTAAGWQSGRLAQAVFGLFTVALVVLAIAVWADSGGLVKVGGWVAAVAGLISWYGATATLTNATWGRTALPLR